MVTTLGQLIRERRMELNLTQEELAERVGPGVGVRQSEISRLERNRVTLPRRPRMEELAQALDIPVGVLLARSGWAGAEAMDADLASLDVAESGRVENSGRLDPTTPKLGPDHGIAGDQTDHPTSNGAGLSSDDPAILQAEALFLDDECDEDDRDADAWTEEDGDERELRLFVLTAIDVTEREALRQQQRTAANDVARLVRANEEVLAANQELANTILRLRSKNEELLVSVEEIQAATEQFEMLNEELQASNEELETLNEELQATVEELTTSNDDLRAKTIELQSVAIDAESARQQLRAIIDGVEDAVVVVDTSGNLALENTAYFTLIAKNRDAVMVDSSHKPIVEGELPIQRASRGEQFSMRFAFGQSDHETWYIANGNPTTTANGTALGIVTIREDAGPS